MKAFFYGVALQWRLDIRSKTMLITCYLVPLLFIALMGGIFTSLMPHDGDGRFYGGSDWIAPLFKRGV